MWKFLVLIPILTIGADSYVPLGGNGYGRHTREDRDERTDEKGSQCGSSLCSCMVGPGGPPGVPGVPGMNGWPGEMGSKGEKGDRGEQGFQGIAGKRSSIDFCGSSFCICMVGPGGPPGVPGVPGMNGWPGEMGSKGEKGDRGEQGFQGIAGEIGPPGPTGPEGIRGRRGYPGDPGKVGQQGRVGPKGDRGFPGMPGLKGNRGDTAAKPPRVAFSVARSHKLGPVLDDTNVTFDKIYTNLGGAFDERTSNFVCKVNGTYVFMAHILGQKNQEAHAWIMLNNHHQVPIHADSRDGYGTGSQTFIMHLKYDDHIWMTLANQSGLMNDYTTFSGYLLYEDDPELQEELSNYLETNDFNDYWKFK